MRLKRKAFLLGSVFGAICAGQGAAAQDGAGVGAESRGVHAPLERLVVVGSYKQAETLPGAGQFLDAAALDQFNYGDVNRVLRLVPGVYLQEEEGFGLRPNIGIRGSGNDRSSKIALMEDGVPIAPAPYAASSAYYFPSMARMSSVEIVKGPAAIKYGPQTIGGAINLYSTPIPEGDGAPGGFLNLFAGEDGLLRGHGQIGGYRKLGTGVEIGASLEYLRDEADGFKQIDRGGPTGFEVNDYVGKLTLRTAEGVAMPQSLSLKYQQSDQLSDETYLGLTLADFQADPYRRYNGSQLDRMQVDHKTYQLTHFIDFGSGLDLTTNVYKTETARAWYKLQDVLGGDLAYKSLSGVLADPTGVNAAAYANLVGASGYVSPDDALRVRNNARTYEAFGVQMVVGWALETGALSHQLEVAARYHEDEEDRFQDQDGYRMDNGSLVLTSDGAPGSQTNRLSEARAWAFFIRDEINWGALTVVPGLRYETIELEQTRWSGADPSRTAPTAILENDVDVWIPGLGILYAVTDDLQIFAGANRGFANPAPGSTADAEQSWNYEAGARFGRDGVTAEIVGFFNDYSNLVGTCTASTGGGCTIGAQFDGGEAEVTGVEITAAIDAGPRLRAPVSVPVSLSYTFTDATFQNSFSSAFGPWGTVVAGDQLPHVPETQWTLTGGLAAERWRTTLSVNYVSEAREIAGQGAIPAGERIDDRVLWDWSGEIFLSDTVAVFGSVENVSDEVYNVSFSPSGARPGKPRTALAGLKLTF